MPDAAQAVQAETQIAATPENSTEESLAHQAALRMIDSEEAKEAAPETPAAAEPAKQEAEAPPPAPEFEWEKVKAFKHKFTVKGEGGVDEEVEVPLEEMQSGYMRYKDYHRKTTEIARAKEAVTDEVRRAIEPKARELDEKLQTYDAALVSALAAETNGVDLDKLAQEDPAAWAQRMQAINRLGGLINRIRSERAQNAQRLQEEQKASYSKAARSAVEELQRDIPGWNNDLYSKILKAGADYGFRQEELNAITDPRAIKVLHEAMQFRALRNAKPQVEKRVVETPKPLKAGAANEKPDASAEKWNSGMEALRRNPKDNSAAVRVARLLVDRDG